MMTLAQLIATFDSHYQVLIASGESNPKTLAWYLTALRKLKPLNDREAASLRVHDLAGFRLSNHFVRSLKALYRWAVDEELLLKDPFRRLKTPPAGERSRVLSRGEIARLYFAAGRPFRRYLFIQLHTLARPGEIRKLRWRDVRFDDQCIVLKEFKGKRMRRDGAKLRTIALDALALRMLRNLKRKSRDPSEAGAVFTDRNGKPMGYNAARCAMRRARAKAGLDGDGERVVCYTLRHTGATEATKAGLRDRVLADVMGHTTTRTTARYQHLDTGTLVEAVEKVRKHRAK